MEGLIFNSITMLILGILTHFAMELAELTTKKGEIVSPITYVKERPYRTFLSITGSLVAYGMLMDTLPPDSIHTYMAFGAGYLADSGAKSAANITRNTIEGGHNGN